MYTVLTSLFCVSLIISNLISGKLWMSPFGILTAGILLFPVVYIIGDVIPEVYGLKRARQTIWLAFGLNALAVLFYFITLYLPYPGFWSNQSSFEIVLGFTPRLLVASFIAFLVGSNANAWVLVVIKKWTNGKWLWMRTIGSTVVGESLDSTIFITIAFVGTLPVLDILSMVFIQALFKTLYEAFATPITYIVINYIKKIEKS